MRKILFIVLLLFTFNIGHGETVISRKELETELVKGGVYMPKFNMITHLNYLVIDKPWITNKLTPYWKLYRIKNEIWYKPTTTNCEYFSHLCRCFSQTLTKTNATFGVFFYYPGGDKKIEFTHAVNVALVNNMGKYEVVFFDPQTYKIVELSKQEIKSCFYLYF